MDRIWTCLCCGPKHVFWTTVYITLICIIAIPATAALVYLLIQYMKLQAVEAVDSVSTVFVDSLDSLYNMTTSAVTQMQTSLRDTLNTVNRDAHEGAAALDAPR